MKNRRYRFFQQDEKALILAFDHAAHGNLWIDPRKVINGAVAGGIDGILTTYGVISNFRKEIGKIGTMLRMEILGSGLKKTDPILGQPMGTPFTIEDCLYAGVDGVMTMGILGNEYDTANLNHVAKIAAECNKYGLISAAEMLPNGFSKDPEDRNIKTMNIACRVAAEIGVDIVKTEFITPVEDFKKVTDNCYVDVLALGGAPVADDALVLENAYKAMQAGCKGLIIGRNVWGHENITGMAAALRKIVHEDATVEEALKELA